jgi:hypothetical protein
MFELFETRNEGRKGSYCTVNRVDGIRIAQDRKNQRI